MSILSFTPTKEKPIHELADKCEIDCLINKDGLISAQDIISDFELLEEEDHTQGVDEEDESHKIIDDVFAHIEDRKRFCKNNYPFKITNQGNTLSINSSISGIIFDIYKFFLFATRQNMKTDKIKNNLDGTQLFEKLCVLIIREYMGQHADSFLFGTSSKNTNFKSKVKLLIGLIKEGVDFHSKQNTNPSSKKDDKLDIVGWVPFADCYGSQLIGFGQCKTGSNWENEIEKLNPDTFCKLWFQETPLIDPIRFYFITEGILRSEWGELGRKGGILFDRFRIMNFIPNQIDSNLLKDIKNWNKGVIGNDKKLDELK